MLSTVRPLNVIDKILTKILNRYSLAFPRKTPDGCQIIFNGLRLEDSSIFHYCSSLKAHFLTVDSCIHDNPTTPGYIFLFDLSKFTVGHIFKWSPFLTRTLTRYTQVSHILPMIFLRLFDLSR